MVPCTAVPSSISTPWSPNSVAGDRTVIDWVTVVCTPSSLAATHRTVPLPGGTSIVPPAVTGMDTAAPLNEVTVPVTATAAPHTCAVGTAIGTALVPALQLCNVAVDETE